MFTTKKIVCTCAALAFCSMVLSGCGEDREKETKKNGGTTLEQLGRDAAQSMQKPLEDARNAAEQVGEKTNQMISNASEKIGEAVDETVKQADQVIDTATGKAKEVTRETEGKEKRKLEGC